MRTFRLIKLAVPVGLLLHAGAPFSPRKLAGRSEPYFGDIFEPRLPQCRSESCREADPARYLHRVKVAYAITERQFVRIGEVTYLGTAAYTSLAISRKQLKLPPKRHASATDCWKRKAASMI